MEEEADLFESTSKISHEPLASRMRPRNLDEYIGQSHIVGKGRLLRRSIAADQLTSVIFYGPPGTGKTTLAKVIANHTSSNFITLNAVLTGVADIRKAISEAESQKNFYGRKTILFVDEVHRWNKSQQDALLPWVENGTIILIGATTENPFFEVNKALVSRSRVFQLKPLTEDDLFAAAERTMHDKERGYGKWDVSFEEGALEHLVETANGDARSLLNALELAVETTPEKWPPKENEKICITREIAEESIQKKVILYDKDGDYHYDIISAFIKSLRGRDPDAACYWLARMMKAGEDPHFVFRRMLISSCEDTGLADPFAIQVVESCASAFDRVGLPEGYYFLAHAALYLATSPKSNSSMAFFDAMREVEKQDADVPNHLRDASRDAEGFGHGAGYLYPHAYRDHWVAQQYLPDQLTGKAFYTPQNQGYEAKIRQEVLSRREIQLASILESGSFWDDGNATENLQVNPVSDWWNKSGHLHGFKKKDENLTFSPENRSKDSALKKADRIWKQRIETNRADTLLFLRNSMVDFAEVVRHSVCLVVNADDMLLLFELVRRTPEGLVCGLCRSPEAEKVLRQYASTLDDLDQPKISLIEGKNIFDSDVLSKSAEKFGDVGFDIIFLRDPFSGIKEMENFCSIMRSFMKKSMSPTGKIMISQKIPSSAQHVGQLVKKALSEKGRISKEESDIFDMVEDAESEFFNDGLNPLFSWNETSMKGILEDNGFSVRMKKITLAEKRSVSPDDISRWMDKEKSAYGKFIAEKITDEAFSTFKKLAESELSNQTVIWKTENVFCIVSCCN